MHKRPQRDTFNPNNTSLRQPIQPHAWSEYDQQNINQLRPSSYKENLSSSPFTNKKIYKQMSPSQDLDSVQNFEGSRLQQRSGPNFNNKLPTQSQEIAFLKQKLIETHNKLIKELDNNNKLAQRLTSYEKQVKNAERAIQQLQNQIKNYQNQLDQANRLISRKTQKNEQKYKSVETRLQDENRKNYQLREELESMRNKMMETTMQKTTLQEVNDQLKIELKSCEQSIGDLNEQIRYKNDQILSMEDEMNAMNKKIIQLSKQIEDKNHEIDQLNVAVDSKKQIQQQLQHVLKIEQQRNNNLASDVTFLQNENKKWQDKLSQQEKIYEKEKEELSWMLNKQDMNCKNLSHEVQKLTDELQIVNNLFRETEKELNEWKKKPMHEAEKKRRHYEITKEFVNQLENEQQLYGNTMVRNSRQNTSNTGRGTLTTPTINIRPPQTGSSRGTSPQNITRANPTSTSRGNIGYFQNRSPPSNKGTGYPGYDERNKMTHSSNNIEQLEQALISCNMERKKIKSQIEKIDELKVKTREMIVKKKRLEQQLQYQEQKIKKVKEQLRRLRLT